ncbi:MAG: hypothetical protein WCP07_13165, partial [bacterium]
VRRQTLRGSRWKSDGGDLVAEASRAVIEEEANEPSISAEKSHSLDSPLGGNPFSDRTIFCGDGVCDFGH